MNKDFAERMLGAAKNDVNVNALVNPGVFAKMIPLTADSMLKKITPSLPVLLKQVLSRKSTTIPVCRRSSRAAVKKGMKMQLSEA